MDKKKIFLVSLGHLSCDVNGGALPALLPFLIAAYGFNYQAAAGLMFAYSCFASVIQPVFGYLSDRFSKPWFIPLGVLLAGGGVAASGFLNAYWAIFAVFALSGIGSSLFHPEGARFANKVSGASKGTGLSLFSIGGNSGFVLGPLLAAASVSHFGMHGTAVFGLIALATSAILLYQIAHLSKTAGTAAGRSANAPEEPGSNNWREFSKLTVVIISRSILFVGLTTFIPLYWIYFFETMTASGTALPSDGGTLAGIGNTIGWHAAHWMQLLFGGSKTAGAAALTFFCVFGVLSNFVGGYLSDRLGYLRIIRVSYLVLIPAIIAFGFVDNQFAALALLLPLGFSLYAPFSSLVVLGQKYLARNIGFASGVTLGLATSMGGIFAPVLGWIADTHGLPAAIRCMSVVAVLGALFAFRLTPSRATSGA